jgi:hypothetical protein
MSRDGSLIEYERVFEELGQNLEYIGKVIDPEELIVLYANSLLQDIFGNWIQAQMAFIDKMTVIEFKGRVREEARRLNICGLNQGLCYGICIFIGFLPLGHHQIFSSHCSRLHKQSTYSYHKEFAIHSQQTRRRL